MKVSELAQGTFAISGPKFSTFEKADKAMNDLILSCLQKGYKLIYLTRKYDDTKECRQKVSAHLLDKNKNGFRVEIIEEEMN